MISVTISGTSPAFQDVEVDASVKANTDCRTEYSDAVDFEDIGLVGHVGGSGLTVSDLENGRLAAISEMKARGDSLARSVSKVDASSEESSSDGREQDEGKRCMIRGDEGVLTGTNRSVHGGRWRYGRS